MLLCYVELKITFAAVQVDTVQFRGRFGGLRGLRLVWLLCVIIDLTTIINYRCNYFKYEYSVKTCMCTISALHQIINLNVSTYI